MHLIMLRWILVLSDMKIRQSYALETNVPFDLDLGHMDLGNAPDTLFCYEHLSQVA